MSCLIDVCHLPRVRRGGEVDDLKDNSFGNEFIMLGFYCDVFIESCCD